MMAAKAWFVGWMSAQAGGLHPDVFQSDAYFMQRVRPDGSWGSYLRVTGPYTTKREATAAGRAGLSGLSGLGETMAPSGRGWEYSTSTLSSIANRIWQKAKFEKQGWWNQAGRMDYEIKAFIDKAQRENFTKAEIDEAVRIGMAWAREGGFMGAKLNMSMAGLGAGPGPQPCNDWRTFTRNNGSRYRICMGDAGLGIVGTPDYYTVAIQPGYASQWQSPTQVVTRGAFGSRKDAIAWAKKNLPRGVGYKTKLIPGVSTTATDRHAIGSGLAGAFSAGLGAVEAIGNAALTLGTFGFFGRRSSSAAELRLRQTQLNAEIANATGARYDEIVAELTRINAQLRRL